MQATSKLLEAKQATPADHSKPVSPSRRLLERRSDVRMVTLDRAIYDATLMSVQELVVGGEDGGRTRGSTRLLIVLAFRG